MAAEFRVTIAGLPMPAGFATLAEARALAWALVDTEATSQQVELVTFKTHANACAWSAIETIHPAPAIFVP